MATVTWSPGREITRLQEEMNRLLNQFFGSSARREEGEDVSTEVWYPPVDIKETRDAFVLFAELPGVNKKDIKITYKNGLLVLEGERKFEEDRNARYHRVERNYGRFFRSFQLPAEIQSDKIQARFRDGVLEVYLPKVEEEKEKEIQISVG